MGSGLGGAQRLGDFESVVWPLSGNDEDGGVALPSAAAKAFSHYD
jgi:hypothetical protein